MGVLYDGYSKKTPKTKTCAFGAGLEQNQSYLKLIEINREIQ